MLWLNGNNSTLTAVPATLISTSYCYQKPCEQHLHLSTQVKLKHHTKTSFHILLITALTLCSYHLITSHESRWISESKDMQISNILKRVKIIRCQKSKLLSGASHWCLYKKCLYKKRENKADILYRRWETVRMIGADTVTAVYDLSLYYRELSCSRAESDSWLHSCTDPIVFHLVLDWRECESKMRSEPLSFVLFSDHTHWRVTHAKYALSL